MAINNAGVKGVKLNRHTTSITFTDDDLISEDQLVEWMTSQIEAVGDNYQALKGELYRTVGYENGYGIGKLVLEASSHEEIAEAFLGMRSISARDFTFTAERFGIPDLHPTFSGPGTITIEPTTTEPCIVKIKGKGQSAITLAGTVYPFALPGGSDEQSKLRFSTPPLDVIWSFSGKVTARISFDAKTLHPLSYFQTYLCLMSASKSDPVSYEVWKVGERALKGDFSFEDGQIQPPNQRFVNVIDILSSFPDLTSAKASFSYDDMDAAFPDLGFFTDTLGKGSLRVLPPPGADLPEKVSHFVYYSIAKIGKWHIARLVRRTVVADALEADQRFITSTLPETIESYVFENATEDQLASIEEDYDEALNELSNESTPVGMGNINLVITSNLELRG